MGTHPIFESDFDCLTDLKMLRSAASRLSRRFYSNYIEENYGKQVHRLANRPGIEVRPAELAAYTLGTMIMLGDIFRDQILHRKVYEEAGAVDEVWNQRIWISPEYYSMRLFAEGIYGA